MEKQVFKGRSSEMRIKNEYLAVEDIDGLGDQTLTIKDVFKETNVKAQDGKTEPIVFTVAFEKTNKRLWLNAVNRKRIANKLGTDTLKWRGQKITLYVEDGIRNPKGGEPIKGIRVKEEKGKTASEKL